MYELKRYDEAVDAYKRAVDLDPKNEDITSKWKEAEAMKKKNKPKVNPDGVSCFLHFLKFEVSLNCCTTCKRRRKRSKYTSYITKF